MKDIIRALKVSTFAVVFLAAFSLTQAWADDYGAIAYCSHCNRWGYSYDYGSRASAERAALNRCGCDECELKAWFYNSCGALAKGDEDALGWSWGFSSRGAAERKALAECERRGSNCEILCWACTSR